MTIQDSFPLGLTGWISFQSKGLSRVFSNTTVQKHLFFGTQLCFYSSAFTSIHDYWKNHGFDQTDLCQQSNVSASLYAVEVGHSFSSKEQESFNFIAVFTICSDLRAPQNKVSHVPIVSPSICHKVMGPDAMILVF